MRVKTSTACRVSAPELVVRAQALGAAAARVIRPSSVATAAWVRLKCQYGCDGYASSLCCPPRTPGPEETRKVIDGYRRAILFEAGRSEPKKIAVELEREAFLAGYYKAFGLGAGPCRLCREGCAFDKGCRHAQEARPCMEACGIDVFATARASGFAIDVVRGESDPAHYFGLLLLD
jgi:predicted metal-binding protein